MTDSTTSTDAIPRDEKRELCPVAQEASFWDRVADQKRSIAGIGSADNYVHYFDGMESYRQALAFLGNPVGKRVLELGCGTGKASVAFGVLGAKVWCTDISRESLSVTMARANRQHVTHRLCPSAMSAMKMAFRDDEFDYIFGVSILQHVDIPTATREIHRLLKSGGRAAFIEATGYHPLRNLYLRLRPANYSPNQSPLYHAQLQPLREAFSRVEVIPYRFFAMTRQPGYGKRFRHKLYHALESLDTACFRLLPFTQSFAAQLLIKVEK